MDHLGRFLLDVPDSKDEMASISNTNNITTVVQQQN
jgi:hypothetical protein